MTEGEERDEAFNRSAPLMLLILVFAIFASYFLFINPAALQSSGEQSTTRTLRQATPEPVIVPAQTYSEGGKTHAGEKQATTASQTKPATAPGETSTQPQEQTTLMPTQSKEIGEEETRIQTENDYNFEREAAETELFGIYEEEFGR